MILPEGGLEVIDNINIGDEDDVNTQSLRRIIIWLYALEGASRLMRCLVYLHFLSEKVDYIQYGISKPWYADPFS